MNANKGFKNIITSILSQAISLAMGVVIPRLVLVNLGSEANGLLSSINDVLVYVALLEAGVGMAASQALYGPLGRDDHDAINGILAATDRFYKRTGRIYLAIVLLLTFVFPLTIETTLPRSTVMWVMLLSGIPGVIRYFFQGKYTILLNTEGKGYILTSMTTVVNICTSFVKIGLLLSGYDVVALQVMYLFFNLAQMFFIIWYIRRNYPWLNLSVEPNTAAISQSKNVLVHQVSTLIFNNTDALVLTYFCSLSAVSVYGIYTMLLGIISGVIGAFSGFNYSLGQAFHTNRKQYLKLIDVYELFNMTLTFCLYCIANLFILPFLSLYTEGVSGISYVDQYLPYLFIIVKLLSNGRSSSNMTITQAGHFKQTQYRSLLEAAINIVVSLLCAWKFGIYGVLMGTIAALLYRSNDMILYANLRILGRNPWITYRRWLLNLALFFIVTVVGKWFFSFVALDSYFSIISWAVVTCIVVIPLFFGVASLCEQEVFHFALSLLKPYLHKVKKETIFGEFYDYTDSN